MESGMPLSERPDGMRLWSYCEKPALPFFIHKCYTKTQLSALVIKEQKGDTTYDTGTVSKFV